MSAPCPQRPHAKFGDRSLDLQWNDRAFNGGRQPLGGGERAQPAVRRKMGGTTVKHGRVPQKKILDGRNARPRCTIEGPPPVRENIKRMPRPRGGQRWKTPNAGCEMSPSRLAEQSAPGSHVKICYTFFLSRFCTGYSTLGRWSYAGEIGVCIETGSASPCR
ncbi:hypothetical protein D3C71_1604970 [compost metagenome]